MVPIRVQSTFTEKEGAIRVEQSFAPLIFVPLLLIGLSQNASALSTDRISELETCGSVLGGVFIHSYGMPLRADSLRGQCEKVINVSGCQGPQEILGMTREARTQLVQMVESIARRECRSALMMDPLEFSPQRIKCGYNGLKSNMNLSSLEVSCYIFNLPADWRRMTGEYPPTQDDREDQRRDTMTTLQYSARLKAIDTAAKQMVVDAQALPAKLEKCISKWRFVSSLRYDLKACKASVKHRAQFYDDTDLNYDWDKADRRLERSRTAYTQCKIELDQCEDDLKK
jgi:hypothetical protein